MDGIIITPLEKIYHPKGDILKALKKTDDGFDNFGEAYFSEIHKGEIKGWKKHREMTLNLVVIIGEIKFVIFNERSNEFFSINISKSNYKRLTIKPGLFMAFKGINNHNMVLNIANIEHRPDETLNIDLNQIIYDWKK